MATKEENCEALEILRGMTYAYMEWEKSPAEAQGMLSTVAKRFKKQLTAQAERHGDARLQTEIQEINQKLDEAVQRTDDIMYSFDPVIKDVIHRNREVREMFLGGAEYSEDVFTAMDYIAGNQKVNGKLAGASDAFALINTLLKRAGC
jgi:hypothetical protein